MTNVKAGRPTSERGQALTIYLRPSQVALLKYIGDGKVSHGITKLIDMHADELLQQARRAQTSDYAEKISLDNHKD
ncbi:MAG: hypothetical protein SPL83_02050 [Succinivibrio sp.]|nr:hypothetical protein [Succinivibrio sp.]